MSFLSGLTLLIVALCALGLSSCKPSSERRQVEKFFEEMTEEKVEIEKKVEERFEDTDYKFEISHVLGNGGLGEGMMDIGVEEFLGLPFYLVIRVSGAETFAKAEEVDLGLREILTRDEMKQIRVCYILEGINGNNFTSSFEAMRGAEYSRRDLNLEGDE